MAIEKSLGGASSLEKSQGGGGLAPRAPPMKYGPEISANTIILCKHRLE